MNNGRLNYHDNLKVKKELKKIISFLLFWTLLILTIVDMPVYSANAAEGSYDAIPSKENDRIDLNLDVEIQNRTLSGIVNESDYNELMESFIYDDRWKNGASWPHGQHPYVSTQDCTECVAYAYDFTKYMYGYNRGANGERYTSVDEIRTGDIVFVTNYHPNGHVFVVLNRDEEKLYTAEGHWQQKVRIDDFHYSIRNGQLYDDKGNHLTMVDGYHFVTVEKVFDHNYMPESGLSFSVATSPGKIYVSGWVFDRDDINYCLKVLVCVGGRFGEAGVETISTRANQVSSDPTDLGMNVGNRHLFKVDSEVEHRGSTPIYIYAYDAGGDEKKEFGPFVCNIPDNVVERSDVAELAYSQIGTEGGSKYYNSGDSGAWAVDFAKWCVRQCGMPTSWWPEIRSATKLVKWFQEENRWHDKVTYSWSYQDVSGGGTISYYIPRLGDMAAIETSNDADGPETVGIVYRVNITDDLLDVVVGNVDNKVVLRSFRLSDLHLKDGSNDAVHVIGFGEPEYGRTVREPVGAVELIEGGSGTLRVKGWAFDYDSFSSPLQIAVYIGGDENFGAESYIITANASRMDVNQAYGGGIGNNHGFDETIFVNARGSQDIYIYALDIGSTILTNTNIGSVTAQRVQIAEPDANALTGTVNITWTLKYGKVLTANVTSNNTGVLSYQWKRGNTNINGATSSTYKLVKADIGKYISCEVTSNVESGSIIGITSSIISKADGPVAPTMTSLQKPSRTGVPDGTIVLNQSNTYQYSTNSGYSNSQTFTGTQIGGLIQGTYYIRIAETDVANAGKTATISLDAMPFAQSDYLESFVNIAIQQKGKQASDYGFSGHWCAWFVEWCGVEAGLYSQGVFPTRNSIGTVTNLCNWFINNDNGKAYYMLPGELNISKNSISVNRNNFVPRKGDLICFTWDQVSNERYDHIGIVEKVKNGKVYIIHGNYGSSNWNETKVREDSFSMTDGRIAAYITPNYPLTIEELIGSVTISGTLKYGQTLTANVSNTNNTGTFSYQWKRGTTNISGATGSTYRLVKADIGNKISCVVTSSVETGNISGTTSSVIGKADGPGKPTVTEVRNPSGKGKSDGKIVLKESNTYQYATKQNFVDAKKVTGAEITELKAGIYYIRIVETDVREAGESIKVTVPEGPNFVVGDVNGDGEVNRADRIYLARAIAGWDGYELPPASVADFNGDGEVNRADRIYLARAIAGWDGYDL